MSTDTPPDVRSVVTILRRAGYVRSDIHRPGVGWKQGSTGFRVWNSASTHLPGVPLVAVGFYDAGQHDGVTDDECREVWARHVKNARLACDLYAAAIDADGRWVTEFRSGADDPFLLVRAGESQ